MNIYDFLFIVQFIALAAMFGYRLFNLFHNGEKYDLKIGFLLFIGSLIIYFVGFVIFMIYPERTIYMVLFNLEKLFFILGIFLFIVEIIFNLVKSVDKPMERHNSLATLKEFRRAELAANK